MRSRRAHIEQALCVTHGLLTRSHWGYVYSAKLLTANIFRMVSNVIHVFRTAITCAGRGRGFVPSPWQRITPSTTCRLLGDVRTRREKSTSPPTLRHKQVETQFTWVLNRPLPPIEYSLLRLKGLQIIGNETMLHVNSWLFWSAQADGLLHWYPNKWQVKCELQIPSWALVRSWRAWSVLWSTHRSTRICETRQCSRHRK